MTGVQTCALPIYTAIPDQNIKEAHFVHFFLKDKLPNGGENVEELMEKVQ